VTAHGLQFEHDGGKVARVNLLRFLMALADLVILAEAAGEAAAGQKNSAGTAPADQRLLFTKMRSVTGNPSQGTGGAAAGFSSQPVDTAAAGTEGAAAQEPQGGFSPLTELAAGV
jgi:hypothetical protein